MAEEILKDLVPASDGQYRLIPCECGGRSTVSADPQGLWTAGVGCRLPDVRTGNTRT